MGLGTVDPPPYHFTDGGFAARGMLSLRNPDMHPTVFLAIELLFGVVLALAVTVIVLARIHKARMKQLDAGYSPLPEFALDNAYALHAADAQGSSAGGDEEKYARLSRAAGL
jgi:hypothetical protein